MAYWRAQLVSSIKRPLGYYTALIDRQTTTMDENVPDAFITSSKPNGLGLRAMRCSKVENERIHQPIEPLT